MKKLETIDGIIAVSSTPAGLVITITRTILEKINQARDEAGSSWWDSRAEWQASPHSDVFESFSYEGAMEDLSFINIHESMF
jgi:hypothetical protein